MLDRVLTAAWMVMVVGNVALGLFIGYHAYRGFRRHESGPMRYLSIGLIFLTAIASSLAFANWLAWQTELITNDVWELVQMLYRVFQFVGLALIAYSLYRRP